MEILEKKTNSEHEKVFIGREPAIGYHGIIAIHSTARGPAVGGTRVWNYANEDDALTDALRLSRGMTYKNALAELPLGGGKAVVIGDNKTLDRNAIFSAHGRFIETLGGRFITAQLRLHFGPQVHYLRLRTSSIGRPLTNTRAFVAPAAAMAVYSSCALARGMSHTPPSTNCPVR